MPIGAAFPLVDSASDPGAVRAYIQAVEDLGYDHLVVFDHVMHPDMGARQTRKAVYGDVNVFREALVLLAYAAGITERIELMTGILILPQRQTALVAKQVAELDVLSGGRVRLGIGTGWNRVEYDCLGAQWDDRGPRSEEQIAVLRELWTKEAVTFEGRWHTIPNAGLNPMPVQQPIPIWIGGDADVVLRRIARIGDGWYVSANRYGPDTVKPQVEKLRAYLEDAGRDPTSFGMEAWVLQQDGGPDEWLRESEDWIAAGATHLAANTNGSGAGFPDGHIDLIKRYKEAADGLAL